MPDASLVGHGKSPNFILGIMKSHGKVLSKRMNGLTSERITLPAEWQIN